MWLVTVTCLPAACCITKFILRHCSFCHISNARNGGGDGVANPGRRNALPSGANGDFSGVLQSKNSFLVILKALKLPFYSERRCQVRAGWGVDPDLLQEMELEFPGCT